MVRDQVHLYGDPLGQHEYGRGLRAFLHLARLRHLHVNLCLTAARGDAIGRPVILNNGSRTFVLHTTLGDDDVDTVLSAAQHPVSATAPVVVFGDPLLCRQAQLEFPEAAAVLTAAEPEQTLETLTHILATFPVEHVPHGITAPQLAGLPFPNPTQPDQPLTILHYSWDEHAAGTDLVHEAVSRLQAQGRSVRLHILEPERLELPAQDLRTADLVLQPSRAPIDPHFLMQVMLAARPLVASRFGENATILRNGSCRPIAGYVADHATFEPDRRSVDFELRHVLEKPAEARAMAVRARDAALTHHRPYRLAPRITQRRGPEPLVVLEAPLLELSSSSVLTVQTALALQRRGRVNVRLVPRLPFEHSLGWFAESAPTLLPLLGETDSDADLWISAGWPPRADRPKCRRHLLRVDWEYGNLPADVWTSVQQADGVVVHSSAVEAVLRRAGIPTNVVHRIPHGVDGAEFSELQAPHAKVLDFKAGRTAVLFVGGLIWRKGIDLLLSALLELVAADPGLRDRLCLVVKPLGGDTNYHGYHLGEMLDKVAHAEGFPEVMVVEDELSPTEMAGLYRACDVLVHPYRGEGFGMPVLEARACGMPVVTTAGGSTDDFCRDAEGSARPGCVLIPSARRPVELAAPHVGHPFVLEPDAETLVTALRTTLDDLVQITADALQDAPKLRSEFSWDRAAERIEELVLQVPARSTARS